MHRASALKEGKECCRPDSQCVSAGGVPLPTSYSRLSGGNDSDGDEIMQYFIVYYRYYSYADNVLYIFHLNQRLTDHRWVNRRENHEKTFMDCFYLSLYYLYFLFLSAFFWSLLTLLQAHLFLLLVVAGLLFRITPLNGLTSVLCLVGGLVYRAPWRRWLHLVSSFINLKNL